MACSIAENKPLKALRQKLNLPVFCHGIREDCLHNYLAHTGKGTMGIPGAAIGYCQALYVKKMGPKNHSQHLIDLLTSINAPWAKSHEIFWENIQNEPTEVFLKESIEPLSEKGRTPIIISGLDPAIDLEKITEIMSSKPGIFQGETTLLRVVLNSRESIILIANLMNEMIRKAFETKEMPLIWPLLQGNLQKEEWYYLKSLLEENWEFVNIAVNPFTIDNFPVDLYENVTVAQVILGGLEGITNDGGMRLAKGMKISGAKSEDSYNLFDYFEKLRKFDDVPTLIILGPSLPEWNDEYNTQRIQALLKLMRKAVNIIWDNVTEERREMVWNLSA
jgi:hypothetical protein